MQQFKKSQCNLKERQTVTVKIVASHTSIIVAKQPITFEVCTDGIMIFLNYFIPYNINNDCKLTNARNDEALLNLLPEIADKVMFGHSETVNWPRQHGCCAPWMGNTVVARFRMGNAVVCCTAITPGRNTKHLRQSKAT